MLGLRQTVYNILLEHLEAFKVTTIKVTSFCRVRITRTASEQKLVIAKFNGSSLPPHHRIHLELALQQLLEIMMQKQICVQLSILATLVFLLSVRMELFRFLELHCNFKVKYVELSLELMKQPHQQR